MANNIDDILKEADSLQEEVQTSDVSEDEAQEKEAQRILEETRKNNTRSASETILLGLREAKSKIEELLLSLTASLKKKKEEIQKDTSEQSNDNEDDQETDGEAGTKKAKSKKQKAPKAPKAKDYAQTSGDVHDKLFGVLKKWFIYLLIFSLISMLLYAFFITIVMSGDEGDKLERVVVEDEPDVIIDTAEGLLWKKLMKEDVKRQQEALNENTKAVNKIVEMVSTSKDEQKLMIERGFAKIADDTNASLSAISLSLDQKIDKLTVEFDDKLATAISKIPSGGGNGHPSFPDNAVLLPMPNGGQSNSQNMTPTAPEKPLTKEEKIVEQKKIEKEERLELIYESLAIENVDLTGGDYDVMEEEESNETLPPFMMRKGFTNGVLITGVSAPTFDEGSDNPKPVLISFGADSIISNDYTQDVEGCLASGTASGNIITRRAEVLITNISCTLTKDGKQYAIRQNVKGWIIDGYDGRYGMRGRLVDSSGKLIVNSVLIGLLKGMGDFTALTAQAYLTQGLNTTQIVGAGQTAQPVFDAGTIAQSSAISGAGQGISSGFETVNTYYQKIIDALLPYIDVKGGRKVTILFDGGETITPKEYRPVIVNGTDERNDIEIEVEVGYDTW